MDFLIWKSYQRSLGYPEGMQLSRGQTPHSVTLDSWKTVFKSPSCFTLAHKSEKHQSTLASLLLVCGVVQILFGTMVFMDDAGYKHFL